MNPTLKKALSIMAIALGLALLFNFLFFGKQVGISVFVFVSCLLAAVFAYARDQKLQLPKSWWLVLPILLFALMPSIRANEFLAFLNVVATLALLMLFAHQITGTPAFLLKLRDVITLPVLMPLRMLRGAVSTLAKASQIHGASKQSDTWIRTVKGVLMAVPILLIFGILFSQADLAFSQFIKNFIDISISERSAQYIALLVFAFVAGLSFLSYIFWPRETKATAVVDKPETPVLSGKNIEVMVFLGLIATLFLIFIIFQITYLFGGESNIASAGFTYAEYARRGFFELLAVAVLSLLLLLASEKYAGADQKTDKRFLVPALVLVTEVVVIIISAFKLLSLYIDAYSLTSLRFYVAAFIILLLVLFILLAVKFIQTRPEQFFTCSALLSVMACLAIVNIVNPDSYIAKSNLKQYNETGRIDIWYVERLSADAATQKLELYKKLEGEDKRIFLATLQVQRDRIQNQSFDWQSANFSRSKALKLLQDL